MRSASIWIYGEGCRRVSRCSGAGVIKKLMTLGEMATLTQTLSDDAIGVLADEFDKKIEIVHAATTSRSSRSSRTSRRTWSSVPGGHDHGARRSREDLAAGRDPRDRGGCRRGGWYYPAMAPTRSTTAARWSPS